MVDGLTPAAGHTWFGLLSGDVQEARAIIEASKLGMLPRVTRRLTEDERARFVRPGAVFVWEEEEAGIRRWTDTIKYSPSRVSGAFLTYTELPGRGDDTLIKQSFSTVDSEGKRLHLIAYTTKRHKAEARLPLASQDPLLLSLMPGAAGTSSGATSSTSSSRPATAETSVSGQTTSRHPPYQSTPSSPRQILHRHPSTPHFTALQAAQARPFSATSAQRPWSSAGEWSSHANNTFRGYSYSAPTSSTSRPSSSASANPLITGHRWGPYPSPHRHPPLGTASIPLINPITRQLPPPLGLDTDFPAPRSARSDSPPSATRPPGSAGGPSIEEEAMEEADRTRLANEAAHREQLARGSEDERQLRLLCRGL